MPFSIHQLDQKFPQEGKEYLLDANVWKFILSLPQNLSTQERAYLDFFDAVINLSQNPLCKHKPFVYVNGLIISEVFNAHIRSCWDAYKATTNSQLTLKSYRGTQDYSKNLNNIKSDFKAYLPYLKIETDLIHSPAQILFEIPTFSDYNDHYYYQLALSKGYVIVTHDGDFQYQNIEIFTMNKRLLVL